MAGTQKFAIPQGPRGLHVILAPATVAVVRPVVYHFGCAGFNVREIIYNIIKYIQTYTEKYIYINDIKNHHGCVRIIYVYICVCAVVGGRKIYTPREKYYIYIYNRRTEINQITRRCVCVCARERAVFDEMERKYWPAGLTMSLILVRFCFYILPA